MSGSESLSAHAFYFRECHLSDIGEALSLVACIYPEGCIVRLGLRWVKRESRPGTCFGTHGDTRPRAAHSFSFFLLGGGEFDSHTDPSPGRCHANGVFAEV